MRSVFKITIFLKSEEVDVEKLRDFLSTLGVNRESPDIWIEKLGKDKQTIRSIGPVFSK